MAKYYILTAARRRIVHGGKKTFNMVLELENVRKFYKPTKWMSCSMVSMDWQNTAEGETILQYFYNPETSGRKFFGLLERPALPSNIEEVSYKLFVTGNTGVGKTATVARLAGIKCCSVYYETPGIQKTNVYWPVKIWDKIIMFKLQFWDAGENSKKKYSYIFSAGQNKADAIVFIFSFTDRCSFFELHSAISTLTKTGEDPALIVIGTRQHSKTQIEVKPSDIRDFEMKKKISVLKIDNKWVSGRNEVHEVAPILNSICEKLWIRDQDYLYRQGLVQESLEGKKYKIKA